MRGSLATHNLISGSALMIPEHLFFKYGITALQFEQAMTAKTILVLIAYQLFFLFRKCNVIALADSNAAHFTFEG